MPDLTAGFPKGLQSRQQRIEAHDALYLQMVLDLKIPISIEEFDNMSKARIYRLMETQSNRLEEREKAEKARQDKIQKEQRSKELRDRARQASEARAMRNRSRYR